MDEHAAAADPLEASSAQQPEVEERPAPSAAELAEPTEQDGAPEPVRPSDVCRRFGLSPYVLRGLLDEYADWLPQVEGGLPAHSVDQLASIVRWRADGVAPDAIRTRLDAGQKADEPIAALFGRMTELQAALSRSEEHRAQDRDRLMMALVRTQQEIQHLRHELADGRSRRERHRGFWRRLFDR